MAVAEPHWFKSRRSNPSGDCVEVAALPGGRVGVRHSRDVTGPVLVYTGSEIAAFLAGVKDGEFDHLVQERGGAPSSAS